MAACVYTPYMYTSYMIVYASTFRSIMLLLWCYDVLRCPSTSCTYYIVVLYVYTFPPVHALSPPTPNGELFAIDRRRLQRQSAAHRRKLWSNKARQNGWSRFTDNQRLDGPISTSITFQSLSATRRRLTNSAFTPLDRIYHCPLSDAEVQPRVAGRKGCHLFPTVSLINSPLCLSTCLPPYRRKTQQIRAITNVWLAYANAREHSLRIYRWLKSGIFFSMYFRPVYTYAIEISEWKKSNPGITVYLYLSVTRPRRMMAYLFHTPNVDPSRTGGPRVTSIGIY